jgi:hypothetical protein
MSKGDLNSVTCHKRTAHLSFIGAFSCGALLHWQRVPIHQVQVDLKGRPLTRRRCSCGIGTYPADSIPVLLHKIFPTTKHHVVVEWAVLTIFVFGSFLIGTPPVTTKICTLTSCFVKISCTCMHANKVFEICSTDVN